MPDVVIADTSSLIALEKIDLLPILCKIYTEVVIPDSVINEFGNLTLPCLSIKKVKNNLLRLLVTDLNLGRGEADVIALANQRGLKVIIDDSRARRVANNMGLEVTGTIGVIIKAKKMGLIEDAYTKVKELKEKGFFISNDLLEDVLKFSETI